MASERDHLCPPQHSFTIASRLSRTTSQWLPLLALGGGGIARTAALLPRCPPPRDDAEEVARSVVTRRDGVDVVEVLQLRRPALAFAWPLAFAPAVGVQPAPVPLLPLGIFPPPPAPAG